MGPLISAGPARDGRLVRQRRRAGRDPRRRARRARLLVPAHRAVPGRRTTTAPRARRSSARSLRDPVPRRGRGGPRSPTTRSTGSRARSGPATAPRRCARRARSRPACSRSTRTPRCASPRRSAASSSRASAASSGPDALDAYSEVKNVYYATEEELMAGRLDGQGLRDHRRGGRHRRRDRAAVRGGGRDGRGRGPARGAPRATSRSRPTSPTRSGPRHVRAGARASSAASTCSSTTRASRPNDDASVLDTSLEAWQRVQDVNLKSSSSAASTASRTCSTAGGGSVINTASFVAVMGAATSQISYTASKGGVLALSRELGVEFAQRGRARQRAVPGPGGHAAAAGALREGPRGGGAAARPPADGPLRRGPRDRQRRRCSWRATRRPT